MIDILEQTGQADCKNCGGKIVRLQGSMTFPHWTHEIDNKLQRECPGAPVAEPAPECVNHVPVQHRDGRPPWCESCQSCQKDKVE